MGVTSLSLPLLQLLSAGDGAFVAIAFFVDFAISTAVRGITDDCTSCFIRSSIVLIEDELFRHLRSDWPRTIESLDEKFAYKLVIVNR